jgi:hypothetical protein
MPIRALLKDGVAFSPEDARVLIDAFEDTLQTLNLSNREDPLTLLVAKHIIKLAESGERDPVRLRDKALALLKL